MGYRFHIAVLFGLAGLTARAAEPPSSWTADIQRRLAETEYEVTASSGAWQAPNREQGFRTWFGTDGIRIGPRTEQDVPWELTLRLSRHGRSEAMQLLPAPTRVDAAANEVTLARDGVLESYVNDRHGLEQSFTIPGPSAGDGESFLDLELSGTLLPTFSEDGQAAELKSPEGKRVLRYASLRVVDARGRALPSRMEGFVEPGLRGLRLRFNDDGAVYPVTVDLLISSAAWTAESDQADAAFGMSVATAGDVNADGYSDVIVGASSYDNGQTDEGRAYLYLGSAAGLASTPAWTGESDQANSGFGTCVAPAGDVNGDGYADVLVGSPNAFSLIFNGRVYLYLGSASGLATTPASTLESDQLFDRFGSAVATAGDVNGDGFADVIVGVPSYDHGQTDEGRAYVYLGSASGLAASPAWTAESDQAGAFFGIAVSTAGDVNGDGYADVIVGASNFDNGESNEGEAFVYLGSATGLSSTAAWAAEGEQVNAGFGYAVANAGDVNGDGYADVVVGAPYYTNGTLNEGRAFVYPGAASGLEATPVWIQEGGQLNAWFGSWVATAGDVNGDGYADVIVGAPLYDRDEADEGQVYLYLGSVWGLDDNTAWTAESDQLDARFGASVATAGDVNGDGYGDLVVGANLYDNGQSNEGRAYVYLGSSSGLVSSPASTVESDQAGSDLGFSIAAAGDVNGDGYSDVIVGAPYYDNGQSDEGRAYLYSGSASGLGPYPAWSAESDQPNSLFGYSVSTAGDVNGDGYSDVVVGAMQYDNGFTDEGRAFVFLGSASGLASTPSWTVDGQQAGARLGQAVAGAEDVNGDGYGDVLVGAPSFDNGQTDEGQAYLYLGSATGLAFSPAWTMESDQASAYFGSSLGTAGDVNGDGHGDVLVGAPYFESVQTDEGRAFLYLGSAAGLAQTAAWTAEADQSGAKFGLSVATAGDVNGDGYSDVIVGAPSADHGQFDEGRAYVYLGSSSGLASSPAWTAESNLTSTTFGNAVSAAGDVNGDGFGDVIVGAKNYTHFPYTNEGLAHVYLGSASGLAPIATWAAAGFQSGAFFGTSVATAGDVNGDGFSDVIAGAPSYSHGQAQEGSVFVFYGGGGDGLDRIPQQVRTGAAIPVALLGKSDSENGFRLQERGRTPAGRGRIRLQYETKPLGTAFSGTGLGSSPLQSTGTPGAAGSLVNFNESLAGLSEGTFYHWRARVVSTDPFFPRSPWMSMQGNNVTESKLRTAGCVDRDGDGYGAVGDSSCLSLVPDCSINDATIWNTPGESSNLRFMSKTVLSWDVPASPGALTSALVYDTLRSGLASSFLGASCVESDDGPNTTASDVSVPSAGQAAYYLNRAQNACPAGVGSLGTTHGGVERAGVSCP